MIIKIQIFGRIFSICMGYKTDWFEQMDFFTICEEWYEKREVIHADLLFTFWRERRWRNDKA